MIMAYRWWKPKIQCLRKFEYFIRSIKKGYFKQKCQAFEKLCSFLCTQYLVGTPFAWITASLRRGKEAISLWHCSGGMEAQVALIAAFRPSAWLGLVSLFLVSLFLLTIPHRLFKQHGFCASPLFIQTLGPWFPNEMQNILSSEMRTLDPWPTVQLFFSLAQVRCFWRCFCFRSGLVALFLKMSERGDSWCTDSSFSSLLVKFSQVFESQFLPSSQLCI